MIPSACIRHLFAACHFLTLLLVPLSLRAEALIEASGEIPADALDQNGDTVAGIGSGLVYDAKHDLFYCIPDRGPGDGTMAFRPRYLVLKASADPANPKKLNFKIEKTVLFRDKAGHVMTGLIPDDREADTPRMKDGRTCLDPEAIALAPDGRIYVSDEYTPAVYQFHPDGSLMRRLDFPESFRPKTADGRTEFTDKEKLVSGRNVNQGGEAMTILPDGKTLLVLMQSGLVQDGGRLSPTTKALLMDIASGNPVAIYEYKFSPEKRNLPLKELSVNDVAALDSHRFLVLERDGSGRDGSNHPSVAAYKSVWLADTLGATNLLTAKPGEPVQPMAKSFLFNLTDLVNDPSQLNAKWEGIAILPGGNDDSVHLMMAADNDFLNPTIMENGIATHFPRAVDAVPTQFFKIQATLPKP